MAPAASAARARRAVASLSTRSSARLPSAARPLSPALRARTLVAHARVPPPSVLLEATDLDPVAPPLTGLERSRLYLRSIHKSAELSLESAALLLTPMSPSQPLRNENYMRLILAWEQSEEKFRLISRVWKVVLISTSPNLTLPLHRLAHTAGFQRGCVNPNPQFKKSVKELRRAGLKTAQSLSGQNQGVIRSHVLRVDVGSSKWSVCAMEASFR